MLKKLKQKNGFTLIELIVVIAVIAILAAVILPRFAGVSDRAKWSAAKADAKNISTAIEMLVASGADFEATDADAANDKYGPKAIMGYVGNDLGGELSIVLDDTTNEFVSFTYKKEDAGKVYTITYTAADGKLTEDTVASGTITPTTGTSAP